MLYGIYDMYRYTNICICVYIYDDFLIRLRKERNIEAHASDTWL